MGENGGFLTLDPEELVFRDVYLKQVRPDVFNSCSTVTTAELVLLHRGSWA